MRFLTEEMALEAIGLVLPLILRAVERSTFKRRNLYVVVLDPGVPFQRMSDDGSLCSFRSNPLPILCEWSFGEKEEWEYSYDVIAKNKAMISWRTGLPTRTVLLERPHLLESGDTQYWGSAVLNGIIVGVSGVQPYFDEMVAYQVAAACQALATEALEKWKEENGKKADFV